MCGYTSSHVFSNSTLVEVLDDLCVRFIVNLPVEELGSVERVGFQIEEAQWYYEDFVRGHNPSLPTLNLRAFAAKIFQHCPNLQEWKDQHEQALNQFIAYKTRVPVRGAILLNHDLDQCVLVRGMKSSASWSFPRGKINQDESDDDCAIREVLEETGFDASDMVNLDWYIETTMRSQNMRLYIIPGVPTETEFAPRTRGEIGTIQWHRLADLPTFSKQRKNGADAPKIGKFYMVAPFLPSLRRWIQNEGMQWKNARGDAIPEAIPAQTDDEQIGVHSHDQHPAEENAPSQHPDSSASLRSLLGIQVEIATPPVEAHQAEAAAKLMTFLSGNASPKPVGPASNLTADGQILLALLQSGGAAQAKSETGPAPASYPPEAAVPRPPMQVPETPPARVSAAPSPHPNLAHRTAATRTPSGAPFDTPTPPQKTQNYGHNFQSQPPPNPPQFLPSIGSGELPNPYSQPAVPVNPLLSGLHFQKPATMNDQTSALLKTLRSGNSPPRQQQQPAPLSVPSPMDAFFAQHPQKPPDPQQTKSLLSILRGESQPAPLEGQSQQSQQQDQVRVTPTHVLKKPTPPAQSTPPAQTMSPISVATRAISERPRNASSPASHTPISPPKIPRGPRLLRRTGTPKPLLARNHTLPPRPPPSQLHPQEPSPKAKRFTPPLEPYINGSTGTSTNTNGGAPALARYNTEPMFDRRETTDTQQQATLLALFKKPSTGVLRPGSGAGGEPVLTSQPEGTKTASTRLAASVKRVQSQQLPVMKSGTGGVSLGGDSGSGSGGGAQGGAPAPSVPGGAVAFAKDAFLLSYLEGVAKEAGK